MKIYTIIVTYNGMKWLDRCLGSLRLSTLPVYTIVVDNDSSDESANHIEKNFPEVELIRSTENLGFGKGNNVGMKKALDENADYVFLLNQDAWIEPNTIEKLVEGHQTNTEFGVLSPVHLNGTGTGLETKFAEYASPDNTPDYLSDLYMGTIKKMYQTKFVNAAAWLISKECLIKTGGFNPLFPHYGEDENYLQRVKFVGLKIGIVTKATIVHDSVFSWEKIQFNPQRNLIFNLIPLADPNLPYRSACLVFEKRSLDELTSYLLFRKFKNFRVRGKAFWQTLLLVGKIRKSRNQSKIKTAFL
jgi:GT2 family glycosyltransferase